MSKNLQRLKKLKAYSAYATAFIAAQQTAMADIKYINVDPDYDITQGNAFELDINNDNKVDFVFNIQSGYWGSRQALVATDNPNNKVKALCQSYSTWYGGQYTWCNGVGALDQGDSISLSLDWTMNVASYWNQNNYDFFANLASYKSNTGYYYYYTYGNQSPWLGAQGKYLGMRFQIGSNVHYGWIRLDIDDKASKITIKDYAYNTEPFEPILAGEQNATTSIENTDLLKEVAVYSYGNKIKIAGNSELNTAVISIHNLMGQLVYTNQLQGSNAEIELNETTGNYYVVSIQKQDAVVTKKVFVKN